MSDRITHIEGLTEGLEPSAASSQPEGKVTVALRQRAATALERGLGFVEDYGDEFALLRAQVLLEAKEPAAAIEVISARQQPDGSFDPFGCVFSGTILSELRTAALPPELLGTLEALVVLADLRALTQRPTEAAIEFLTRAQQSDGSWGRRDPAAAVSETAEDARARAIEERLFATGMLAGFAARTPFVRPEVLAWAARFLSDLWAPEQVEGGRASAITAFAHFYANGGDRERADEALQWCGRELDRGFRTGRFEAVETVRVLIHCDAQALPGATFDVAELLEQLLDEQAADGGFAALDLGGPPGRVGPTLDGLLALRALCGSF